MNVHDYLIDHSDVDWASVLSPWHWFLPRKLTVWLMNRFGDLFIVLDDGTVHMFDVGGGTVRQVARDRDDFCNLIDDDDNANQWLMIPLIDKLVAAGIRSNLGIATVTASHPFWAAISRRTTRHVRRAESPSA